MIISSLDTTIRGMGNKTKHLWIAFQKIKVLALIFIMIVHVNWCFKICCHVKHKSSIVVHGKFSPICCCFSPNIAQQNIMKNFFNAKMAKFFFFILFLFSHTNNNKNTWLFFVVVIVVVTAYVFAFSVA